MALESVSIRLEKDQLQAVETLASRRKVSTAEVFRQVVGAYFHAEKDERAREESAIVQQLDRHAEALEQLSGHWRVLSDLKGDLTSHLRVLQDQRDVLRDSVGAIQSEARDTSVSLSDSAQRLRSSADRLDRATRRHSWKAWAGVLAVAAVTALGTGWLGSWLWARRHPYAATNRVALEALYYGTQVQDLLQRLDPEGREKLLDSLGAK